MAHSLTSLPETGDGIDAGQLSGFSCVLTGVFDIEGDASSGKPVEKGKEMCKGKDAVKEWLARHGARVVSAVSKMTKLIVGRLPGERKVTTAKKLGVAVVNLDALIDGIKANDVSSAMTGAAVATESFTFSRGFGCNAVGLKRKSDGSPGVVSKTVKTVKTTDEAVPEAAAAVEEKPAREAEIVD